MEKPEGGTDSCPAAVQVPPERTAGLERVGCCWRSESAAASRPDGRQPLRGRPRGGQKTVATSASRRLARRPGGGRLRLARAERPRGRVLVPPVHFEPSQSSKRFSPRALRSVSGAVIFVTFAWLQQTLGTCLPKSFGGCLQRARTWPRVNTKPQSHKGSGLERDLTSIHEWNYSLCRHSCRRSHARQCSRDQGGWQWTKQTETPAFKERAFQNRQAAGQHHRCIVCNVLGDASEKNTTRGGSCQAGWRNSEREAQRPERSVMGEDRAWG